MKALAPLLIMIAFAAPAHAADACQDFVKLKDLPPAFKVISRSVLGRTTMEIRSDGACTCNDLPAVQRALGQAEPSEVNWACDTADSSDAKGR